MRLFCVVVDRPGVLLVDIAPDATVCELQDAIMEKQMYVGFPASELALFVAKQQDAWLSSDDAIARALMRGDPDASSGRLGDDVRMYGAMTIQNAISAVKMPEASATNQIHVLVLLPEIQREERSGSTKRQRTPPNVDFEDEVASGATESTPTAKKAKADVEPTYSLNGGEVYLAGHEQHAKELSAAHRSIYYSMASRCDRRGQSIPMCTTGAGTGKSTLARHYISTCRRMWPPNARSDQFLKTLCECRTLHVVFPRGALLSWDRDAVLIKSLIRCVESTFETPPWTVANPPSRAIDFVQALVREVGPLFIALDDIGVAFEDDSMGDITRRDRFYSFCKNVISPSLPWNDVFFLLLGHGLFLRLVKYSFRNTPIRFDRVSFDTLQVDAVVEMIRKTRASDSAGRDTTIQGALNLDDRGVETLALRLYNGMHEQLKMIVREFKECGTYSELMAFIYQNEFRCFE